MAQAPTPPTYPLANLEPPYCAIIFTSLRRSWPDDGYPEMAKRMVELAEQQPGYLGMENLSGPPHDPEPGSAAAAAQGDVKLIRGCTISYWRDEQSARGWKKVVEHLGAQKRGKREWYERYEVRVANVERAYGGGLSHEQNGGQPSM